MVNFKFYTPKSLFFYISRVLAYVQIGTFIIVLMCTSWFFATFFLQSCLHILGPSAFSLDSIPQDTCCGQRIKQKKKKKQRETWQPKVALKEDSGSLRWLHLMKFSLKIKTEFSKISPIPFHSPYTVQTILEKTHLKLISQKVNLIIAPKIIKKLSKKLKVLHLLS